MTPHIHFTFSSTEFDSEEDDNIGMILSSMAKIIACQLSPLLTDKWCSSNPQIKINFVSQQRMESIDKKNERTSISRNRINLRVNKVLLNPPEGPIETIILTIPMNFAQFDTLHQAVETVDAERKFAMPVHSIRKLSETDIVECRDRLVSAIYQALKQISLEINADLDVLERACQQVKAGPWFIEKEIGEPVSSRRKNGRTAQLIGRWEPDYLYHSARIFESDGTSFDVLFMVYWRAVSLSLLDEPGRLSWMDKDILKYIPKSRTDYRLAFKLDGNDVDFSYYFEPPQHRATKFYAHFSKEAMQEFEKDNMIRLNY